MKTIRKQRLYLILAAVLGLSVGLGLILYALSSNINLFYTPTQISEGQIPSHRTFRVGGVVVPGTVKRTPNSLQVRFVLTDYVKEVVVQYTGILPDLFREGQGIVAQGKLSAEKEFVAEEVLAKHDENYMPPEVKLALKDHTPT